MSCIAVGVGTSDRRKSILSVSRFYSEFAQDPVRARQPKRSQLVPAFTGGSAFAAYRYLTNRPILPVRCALPRFNVCSVGGHRRGGRMCLRAPSLRTWPSEDMCQASRAVILRGLDPARGALRSELLLFQALGLSGRTTSCLLRLPAVVSAWYGRWAIRVWWASRTLIRG